MSRDIVIGCVHDQEGIVLLGQCVRPTCHNCPDYIYADIPHISGVPVTKFAEWESLEEKLAELQKAAQGLLDAIGVPGGWHAHPIGRAAARVRALLPERTDG